QVITNEKQVCKYFKTDMDCYGDHALQCKKSQTKLSEEKDVNDNDNNSEKKSKINTNAERYFNNKWKKYNNKYNIANIYSLNIKEGIQPKIMYRPFILESNGGMLKETKEIIKQIMKMKAIKTNQLQTILYTEFIK